MNNNTINDDANNANNENNANNVNSHNNIDSKLFILQKILENMYRL